MKQIKVTLLSLLCCFLFAACGGGGSDNNNNEQNAGNETAEQMNDAGMEDAGMDDPVMEDSDTEDPVMEEEEAASTNGTYEGGPDSFTVTLTIRDTVAPDTPPLTGDCVGDISVTIDSSLADVISGAGSCLLPANSATYTLTASFTSETEFSGEITFVFNGADHVVPLSGSVGNDGVITVTLMGTTPATSRIVIDWDGGFSATLVM